MESWPTNYGIEQGAYKLRRRLIKAFESQRDSVIKLRVVSTLGKHAP
jgi:hypothetical protein